MRHLAFKGRFGARVSRRKVAFPGKRDSRQSTALEVAKLIEREAGDSRYGRKGRKHGVGNKRLGDEVSRPPSGHVRCRSCIDGRNDASSAEPTTEPFEIQVDDRGRVERQRL